MSHFKKSDDKLMLLILPRLEQFIRRFSKNDLSEFQLELAIFFKEKHNYALAYIALAEAIVSKVAEIQKYDVQKKQDRDLAKIEISKIDNNLYYKVYESVKIFEIILGQHRFGKFHGIREKGLRSVSWQTSFSSGGPQTEFSRNLGAKLKCLFSQRFNSSPGL